MKTQCMNVDYGNMNMSVGTCMYNGGNTELYKDIGTFRCSATIILANTSHLL